MRTFILILLIAIDSVVLSEIPSIHNDEIQKLLASSEESHLGFFGSNISSTFVEKIVDQLGGLISLYRLGGPSELIPSDSFVVYPFGTEAHKLQTRKQWTETEFTLPLLISHLDQHTHNSIELISASYLQNYMGFKIKSEAKIILVLFETNGQKKHLPFRTLSQLKAFKDEFSFVRTMGNPESLKGPLKLDKFPALVCFYPAASKEEGVEESTISAFPYRGTLNYTGMHKFLTLLTNNEFKRKYLPGLIIPSDSNPENSYIPTGFDDNILIQSTGPNASKILDECSRVTCAIAFDNFWVGDDAQFNKTVATLKEVQRRFSKQGMRIILLDGGCHQYLLPQVNLQLETLPGLIAYNAPTLEFHPLMGKFTPDDITNFLMKMKTGVHKPLKLPQLLTLRDLDCAKEFELNEFKREQSEKELSEDDLLAQTREESRKKEEQRSFEKGNRKKKRRSDEL